MPSSKNPFTSFIQNFLKLESASGILLMIAAVLAMIIANSPLSYLYESLLDVPVEIRIGALHIAKPLILWINDGLMAVFFFLIGLELKRELMEGALSNPKNLVLPTFAAVGGMLVPAIIYASINWNDPVAVNGWAIPAATDIAFALGILAFFGKRVPIALKVFLVSLAIMDDMGAIIIIAIFYTSDLSTASLIIAAAATGIVTVYLVELLNRTRLVREDASIALVFPVLFSIGVILIARYAGNIHLDTDAVLLGELAFAPFNRFELGGADLGPKALWLMGAILVLNIALIIVFFKEMKLVSFDSDSVVAVPSTLPTIEGQVRAWLVAAPEKEIYAMLVSGRDVGNPRSYTQALYRLAPDRRVVDPAPGSSDPAADAHQARRGGR